MRHTAPALALALFALAGRAAAQQPSQPSGAAAVRADPRVEREILALERAYLDARLRGDTATLRRLLADDVVSVGTGGRISDRAEFHRNPAGERLVAMDVADTRVRAYGETAVVTGLRTTQAAARRAPYQIRYTHVYARQGGAWRLVSSHATGVPSPAPAGAAGAPGAAAQAPGAAAQPSGRVDLRAEEAALRALIRRPGGVRGTPDGIFWSGAYPRPIVGAQDTARVRPFPSVEAEQRRNVRTTVDSVIRLEVAAAGDMAYEFSNYTVSYAAAAAPTRRSFTGSALRVWKKVNGEWRPVAAFHRPHDRPFAPAPGR